MLVLVQSSLWLSATALCLWQWRQRRTGLWIALAAGAFATGFFVVVVFLLVASLPCPSSAEDHTVLGSVGSSGQLGPQVMSP